MVSRMSLPVPPGCLVALGGTNADRGRSLGDRTDSPGSDREDRQNSQLLRQHLPCDPWLVGVHGTGVAGLAAAAWDGKGMAGVAPGAQLWVVQADSAPPAVGGNAWARGIDWVRTTDSGGRRKVVILEVTRLRQLRADSLGQRRHQDRDRGRCGGLARPPATATRTPPGRRPAVLGGDRLDIRRRHRLRRGPQQAAGIRRCSDRRGRRPRRQRTRPYLRQRREHCLPQRVRPHIGVISKVAGVAALMLAVNPEPQP